MIELLSDERVVAAWTNGRAHFALTTHGNMWWFGTDASHGYKLRWRRVTYDE